MCIPWKIQKYEKSVLHSRTNLITLGNWNHSRKLIYLLIGNGNKKDVIKNQIYIADNVDVSVDVRPRFLTLFRMEGGGGGGKKAPSPVFPL